MCGKSEKGRNIYTLRVGCGKRKMLVTGAIHGREYVTASFVFLTIEEYARAYLGKSSWDTPCDKKLFDEYTIYFVPVSNPDSVEIALGRDEPFEKDKDFSHYIWKDNARGVNLNANFPFEWEKVPQKRNPGRKAASEKETRFLMSLCEKYCFEKLLSLHSRGGCIYWRDKENGQIEGDLLLAGNIGRGCGFSLCPLSENIESYAGGFENWFRNRYKKPALCIELVEDETAPFDLCVKEFEKYTNWEKTKNLIFYAL